VRLQAGEGGDQALPALAQRRAQQRLPVDSQAVKEEDADGDGDLLGEGFGGLEGVMREA
jgi:hypothetical protein